MNISKVADQITARTNPEAAAQRAENLAIMGAKRVLELCVGPSLKTLQHSYAKYKITVTGNDIEQRWQKYYPKGSWIIGDALTIPYSGYDTVVLASPLSKGCSGTREDSLSVSDVVPRYSDFILRAISEKDVKTFVCVLPGRTLSTRDDRSDLHELLHVISHSLFKVDVVPLRCGVRQITKYVDLYITRQ